MEVSGLRLLFLSRRGATTLRGCALCRRDEPVPPASDQQQVAGETVTGEPSDKAVIDPQVERREIKRTRIDTEDFEVGAYVGILSIEDFESNVVYGARLAYNLTEDFFLEGTIGQSRAGRTSYENLSGSAELLTDSERDYTYYALSLGWDAPA